MTFSYSFYGEKIYTSISALWSKAGKTEALPVKASPEPQRKAAEIVVKKPAPAPVASKPAKKKKRKKVYPPLGEFDFYTVVKGDTLWDIAEAYTNNPYDYHLVAEDNRVINIRSKNFT